MTSEQIGLRSDRCLEQNDQETRNHTFGQKNTFGQKTNPFWAKNLNFGEKKLLFGVKKYIRSITCSC